MSIIYNNQVVAGKYTQQVVADADTVNAGIIKLATEEQVIEGVDNTTAITPFYLAQKQDKISAGDGIVIDNNEISCTVNPDEQTIVRKGNGTMQCIGQLTKSNTLKFDWEGTQAEYNVAYLNGTIQPDWYCYITDDEEFVDYGDIANQSLSNLKAEGEARFTAKANTDLDNLSSVGQGKLDIKADKATTLNGYGITDGLNKNQITNCLLEVPQRIKLELKDRVLTLKAGSEVIVPNGFEEDGTTPKFDYVTIEEDKIYTSSSTTSYESLFGFSFTSGLFWFNSDNLVISGTEPTSTTSGTVWYDTANNVMKSMLSDGTWNITNNSLPLGRFTRENGVPVKINQVFNGIGYIGSTIWIDKGVKGLMPDGRNEDGTLKNKELIVNKLSTRTFTEGWTNSYDIYFHENHYFSAFPTYQYYQDSNILVDFSSNAVNIGKLNLTQDVISNFHIKRPFRAVDYNDASGLGMPSSKHIDLTLGADGSTYVAPANGWFYIAKQSGGSGKYLNIYNTKNVPNGMACVGMTNLSSTTNILQAVYVPVSKGDYVEIKYNSTGVTERFRFTYAEGEV